jgi:hypothetical protein
MPSLVCTQSILAHWLNWNWQCLHPLQHLQRTEALQDPVALKFYTSAEAFANEKMIYGNVSIVHQIGAPTALVDNADGAARAPSGFVFPPHLVTERGQSLEEWLRKFETDYVTALQTRTARS